MYRLAATATSSSSGFSVIIFWKVVLMRRLTVDRGHIGKRQQVHDYAVGHQARPAALHLPR